LELSQGSKVDEVVAMIKELLDQIKSDHQADELDYTHRITRLKLDIEELEIILRNLGIEKSATNTFI